MRLDPRLRSEALESAIPTIPYSSIAAFLSRPTVMSSEQIRHAPYVLAFRDMHQVGGSGNEVYVRNLSGNENKRFAVMHVAGPLLDPDDGKVIGYEGIYTATALVQRGGNPAKAVLIDPARETLRGDRLLATDCHRGSAHLLPRAARAPGARPDHRCGRLGRRGRPRRPVRGRGDQPRPAPRPRARHTCSPSTRRAMWCATCIATGARSATPRSATSFAPKVQAAR